MRIRPITEADAAALREVWEEFEREVPEPAHRGTPRFDDDWSTLLEFIRSGFAAFAEDDGGVAGYALAKLEDPAICHLDTLYVRPRARAQGVGKALIAAAAEWGAGRSATHMTLTVLTTNGPARVVYDRLGFEEEARILVAPLATLGPRLASGARGDSHGSIHVQTDDRDAVVRAVGQFVPRLPGGSKGSVVAPPHNGWTAVYDELCDREPAMLRRLALELSDRHGAVVLAIGLEEGAVVRFVLFERGRLVDEYASLPEYHGPLPPGDVVALGANPTVVHRLTGADPKLVRETAKTAATAAELPHPPELLAQLAAVLGVQGAEHGYGAARDVPGAAVLDRA